MFGLFNKKAKNPAAIPAAQNDAEVSPVSHLLGQIGQLLGEAARRRATLDDIGLAYDVSNDGTLTIRGTVDLSGRGLADLPDLSGMTVAGDFICADNNLASLKGAPRKVIGNFDCSHNCLLSLEGGPAEVGGDYICSHNALGSLQGAPDGVNRMECSGNPLIQVKDAALTLDAPVRVHRPLALVPGR